MNPSITTDDLSRYHEEGHLILREAFSSDRILSLRDALERLMDRALAGEIEIGWINQERRLFSRTGHLMSPDRYDPAYGDWLAEDLDPHLQTLLGATPRHSLFGTLAGGGGQPYKQAWHRDLGRPGADDEAEYYRRHHGTFVQFNAPILPGDRFLNIVPASHLRASTPAEIDAAAAGDEAQMPNALVVELEPGDIVYYDANLWHRGWNPEGVNRWSMHCAFWRAECPVMAHETGQQEDLQRAGYLESMPAIAREYVEHYLSNHPDEPAKMQDL